MRPDRSLLASIGEAFRKGWRATAQNLAAILALQFVMAVIVGLYYLWPPFSEILSRYANWMQSFGALGNGVAAAIAGGLISELSLVYFQNKGRWTPANLESLAFKTVIFFVNGVIVYEFYRFQAYWWGQGATLAVLVPKVLLDQFGYTVVWAAPYYAILSRWHALRFSGSKLWHELDRHFFFNQFLPVLVTNWMFWIPAITFVYTMPWELQPPLAVFATAIWALLVPAVTRQESNLPPVPEQIPMVANP